MAIRSVAVSSRSSITEEETTHGTTIVSRQELVAFRLQWLQPDAAQLAANCILPLQNGMGENGFITVDYEEETGRRMIK
jgi:hypothetical protein